MAISDGAALGILFSNFNETDADLISTRLETFEKIRFNKATVMQKFSNAEFEGPEAMRDAAQPYMPGEEVPSEYLSLNMKELKLMVSK